MTIRNRKISQIRLDDKNVDAPTINRALDNIINTVNPWIDEATKAINNNTTTINGTAVTINPQGASSVQGVNFNLSGANGISFGSNGSDTITIYQQPIPDLTSYATKTEVTGAINDALIPYAKSADVSASFTTPAQVSGAISAATQRYYGAFFNSGSVTASVINTAYAVPLPNLISSNGVSVSNNSRINVAHDSVYNIQVTAQVTKTAGASVEQAYFWFSKGGTNIPNSTFNQHMKEANANQVVSFNFIETLLSGNYVELNWATTDVHIILQAEPSAGSPSRPETPSVFVTITQV